MDNRENRQIHQPYRPNDNNQPVDPYLQEYEEQLNRFSNMDGVDYTQENPDLDFQNHDNAYYNNYSQSNSNPQNPDRQYSSQPQYRQNNQRTGADNRQVQNRKTAQSSVSQRQQRPRSASQYSQESYWNDNRNNSNSQQRRTPAPQRKASQSQPPKNSTNPKAKPQKNKIAKQPKGNRNSMENKKKSPVKTFFKVLLIILIVLILIINILIIRYISMVNTVQSGQRDDSITPSLSSDNVKNILLIGSDTRNSEQAGRTDSMILLSVNIDTKEITMTSFMRDMYLPLVGYATDGTKMYDDTSADGLYYDKLNAAYVYGGAELLMDTIEYNFDVKVDDYVYIDFYSFIDIVDSLGGITLKISDEEADGMTAPMAEQNKYLGNEKGTDYLSEGGNLLLNGNQALAYARLRYVGNADFERTERQRTVISTIISTAKSSSPLTIDKFAKACMSHLTTNMSKTDLYFYCYKALFYMNYSTNSLRIPDDNSYSYGTHNGQSTLDVDKTACRQLIKETIYN